MGVMYIRSNGTFSGITGYKFVIVEMVGVKFSPNIVYLLSILFGVLIAFSNLHHPPPPTSRACTCIICMYGACMRSIFMSFISSTEDGKEENHLTC
jgi:ABC-type amino acid transport system permease subunit